MNKKPDDLTPAPGAEVRPILDRLLAALDVDNPEGLMAALFADKRPVTEKAKDKKLEELMQSKGPEMTQAAADLKDWGRENTRRSRDALNDALRLALLDILDRNAGKLGAAVAVLRPWAERDANLEALAEWLEKGGWEKVNGDKGDKVEAALAFAMRRSVDADAAGALRTLKDEGAPAFFEDCPPPVLNCPTACIIWPNRDAPYYVLSYDTPRADANKPDVLAFVDKYIKPAPYPPFDPADWTRPDKATVLLGLDALKAGIAAYDWGGLCLCLNEKAGPAGDWLRLLAVAWVKERAENENERLEREGNARALDSAPRVLVRGREYGRLPKVAAGMSWAFGGGFHLQAVEVGGKQYAPAPDLAILPRSVVVPAGYSLLPADHADRPHQAILPLDITGADDAPPLPVALTDATQYAIAPAAGKLGLLIMAAAWAGKGKLHKTTLRELTAAINPTAAKLFGSHYDTVTRGLKDLDGLRLVLPNGLAYRVFECPVTWRELTPQEYDTALFVGLTRTFEKTLAAIAETAGKSYKGDFLIDLTGAMALPTRRAGLLRQYIRACAFWNSQWKPGTNGEPDPDRVPEVAAERWAGMTNYLTPTAAEYLRGKGKGDRRRLSDSVKETLSDAAYLEGRGLVRLERADRKAIKILWPEAYMEAWREARKGAARMNQKGQTAQV